MGHREKLGWKGRRAEGTKKYEMYKKGERKNTTSHGIPPSLVFISMTLIRGAGGGWLKTDYLGALAPPLPANLSRGSRWDG